MLHMTPKVVLQQLPKQNQDLTSQIHDWVVCHTTSEQAEA